MAHPSEEALAVLEFIDSVPRNTMFGSRQLVSLAKRHIVDNLTWMLVKSSQLIRVGWGIFIHADSTIFPTQREVFQFKAELFGKKIGWHGSSSAESLDLPVAPLTQKIAVRKREYKRAPNMRPNGKPDCVSGASSALRIFTVKNSKEGRLIVSRLKVLIGTCDRKLHLEDQSEGHLIRALWQIGKVDFQNLSDKRLLAIPGLIPSKLVKLAAWMPFWLSDRLHDLAALERRPGTT